MFSNNNEGRKALVRQTTHARLSFCSQVSWSGLRAPELRAQLKQLPAPTIAQADVAKTTADDDADEVQVCLPAHRCTQTTTLRYTLTYRRVATIVAEDGELRQ